MPPSSLCRCYLVIVILLTLYYKIPSAGASLARLGDAFSIGRRGWNRNSGTGTGALRPEHGSSLITMNEVSRALAFASRIEESSLTHSASPRMQALHNADLFEGMNGGDGSRRVYRQHYEHNHLCGSEEQLWALPHRRMEKSYYYIPSRG